MAQPCLTGALSVLESAAIGAILLVTLLPLTVLVGGFLFVPREARYWSRDRLREAWKGERTLLLALVALVPVFVVQSALDPLAAAWVGRDFTGFFSDFDGSLHARVQAATPWAVSFFLAVVYLLGFPVLLYLTPILALWLGDARTAHRAFAAFAGCYLIALPFYFFLPVQEVWVVGKAENLVLIAPYTEKVLYAFNAVDNAFPSMHTAMALAVGHVAFRGPSRSFGWFAVAMAILIPISTVVLGIHWTLDVVAGVAAAGVVVLAVDRFLPAGKRHSGNV